MPQAADLALKGEVIQFLKGLEGHSDAQEHLVCIVSDDRYAAPFLRFENEKEGGGESSVFLGLQSLFGFRILMIPSSVQGSWVRGDKGKRIGGRGGGWRGYMAFV